METEIWKDVKGFEGRYQVSNLGRIKSLRWMQKHQTGKMFLKRERFIKVRIGKCFNGYNAVALEKNGDQIGCFHHRIIAEAFIANPQNKPFINHINGIKTDNRIENLEWCTRSENAKHAVRIGLQKVRVGSAHSMAKLNDSDVLSIRLRYSLGESSWKIFKSFNGSQSYTNIKDIIAKRTWAHL